VTNAESTARLIYRKFSRQPEKKCYLCAWTEVLLMYRLPQQEPQPTSAQKRQMLRIKTLKPAVGCGAEAQLIQPSGLAQKSQLTHRVSLHFCASPSS